MSQRKYPKAIETPARPNQIFSKVRQKWVALTPEEKVRQDYLEVLLSEYGYTIDQIAEEEDVTHRGAGRARADFLIWRTPEAKARQEHALIVVECKADNISISLKDYQQGANYAQYEHARFFVTHNNRETRYWKVDDTRRMPNYDEIENLPHADASDKEIEALLARLKIFKEDEFADLLHQCHNVIRNREKLDPAAAFDEIAKILFIKVCFERKLKRGKARQNLFTAEFLDQQKELFADPVRTLFAETKKEYSADKIFEGDEEVNLRYPTVREIVFKLQLYNLSDTSEDIKGIAFERFLGRTFRGEIGQFFTPRCIVEFMVRMIDPKEGDVICDPASGSGGFLIRFFEIVREKILADADRQYRDYKAELEARKSLTEPKRAALLRERFDEILKELDKGVEGSRLWKLANRCIYGTDANDRMARTSKMNMIMHGDGHGGVHHHDGFLNVNGIFEGRFDIILTNPPFGANVEPSDVITDEQTIAPENERLYLRDFGDFYRAAQGRIRAAKGKAIASLFELPKKGNGDGKSKLGKVKTEILFLERCLDLLKPEGRVGIVLPEGIFNNPSLAYVREFCEDRAFIRAVVSLPQEAFVSSGASVKASLLFMQKFSEAEKEDFDRKQAATEAETRAHHQPELDRETTRLETEISTAKEAGDVDRRKRAQAELRDFQRKMEAQVRAESRTLLKERFPYPIFLYDAEKVGISSTGEADQNELFPNANQPADTEGRTCLEVYRGFLKDPKVFPGQRA